MGKSNKICPSCGRKMKQQFIGLQHCKCGMSWTQKEGYFERTPDMVFSLKKVHVGKKTKQVPEIRRKNTGDAALEEIEEKSDYGQ